MKAQRVLLAWVLVFSPTIWAEVEGLTVDAVSNTSDGEQLIPELDWDFHGRLAVLPLQNKGDKEYDWVSIAIQDALTQDFWHVEAFDTRSLRTFSGKFTELCPKLDLRCVVTRRSRELEKTLSDQFLSYVVSGDYRVVDNQTEITLSWGYARDSADLLPGLEEIVVTSTLENMTDDLSQSLLKWVKNRGIELSSEHAARFDQSKTKIVSALKSAALGYWRHQGYYLNKEDQSLIGRWEEQLLKATNADAKFSQAWNHLGWLYLNAGDKGKALQAFSKSMELNGTSLDALDGLARSQPNSADGRDITLKLKKEVAMLNRGELAIQAKLGRELTNSGLHQLALPVRLLVLGLVQKVFGYESALVEDYFSDVGYTYFSISNYSQSLKYYSRALSIAVATYGDGHINTVTGLNNLSIVYRALGEYRKALEYSGLSMTIKETIHGEDNINMVSEVRRLGNIYMDLDEYPKALEYYTRSLAILEATHGQGHINTAATLNNLGGVFSSLGDYPKALGYFERSLTIFEEKYSEGNINTAVMLNNLGVLHDYLGEYPKALMYLKRSLAINEVTYGVGHISAAGTLRNLGSIHTLLSDYPKALEYCERSLTIFEENYGEAHIRTASSLNCLGSVYHALDDYPKALEYYARSLAINEVAHGEGHISTAGSLNNLGGFFAELGEYPKALEYLERSLTIVEATHGAGHIEMAVPLKNLSLVWKAQQELKLAIAYGKRAVNILQTTRAEIKSLDPELQQSYKESIQGTYQRLAKLLFADGQIALGEKVLSMLKDTEQSIYRSVSTAAGEQLLIDEVELNTMAEMSYFSRNSYRFNQLVELKNRTAEETVEYKRLRKVVGVEKKVREQKIAQILEPLKGRVMQVGLDSTRSTAGQLIALEKEYGQKAAVLYLFPSEETFNHVLITQTGPYVFSTELDPEELNSRIPLLRRALMPDLKSFEKKDAATRAADWEKNQQELMKHSQWLYDVLIRPIEKELKASGADNLMVYLGGAVRYLPIAALHDGQQYFLENYTLSLLVGSPEKSMGGTQGDAFANLRIAAMGTNTAHTEGDIVLNPLSAIEGELDAVVRERFWDGGSFSGTRFLNKEFTPDAFYEVSEQGEYKLLHLATHFIMQPGFFSSSSLLFGSPELVTINTLGELWSPRKIEVLTLSACSTALSTGGQTYSSDGRGAVEVLAKYASGAEVDSFAAMALQQNIKTVIATLWNIEDNSTALFMTDFYNHLSDTDNFTRSGALRQAQLNLLQNKVDISQGNKNALETLYGLKDYSHPFFWAPFIMMGQWM